MSFAIAIALFLTSTYGEALTVDVPADLPIVHRQPTPLPYDPATEVVVTLLDERKIVGKEISREGEFYRLAIEGGTVLTIPVVAVLEVETKMVNQPATGFRRTTAELLPGSGGPARLPDPAEQLAELRESESRFQKGVIDPNWVPSSDWSSDPALNNFNPSSWYRAPIDPSWRPTSDFTLDSDVTEFRPTRWMPSIIDSSWVPTDGFGLRRAFWERLSRPVEEAGVEPAEKAAESLPESGPQG